MTYNKKEKPFCGIYTIEEDDNLRLGQYNDIGSIVCFFVIYLVIQTVLIIYFVDIIINGIDIVKTVCCGAIILFFTLCFVMTLYYFLTYKNYSLIVGSCGIKNKTNKGTVLLPWDEFKQIDIVKNVAIIGHRGYHNFIYISNSDLNEGCLRKIIKSSDSRFYITTESELVITLRLYNEEETEALYSKLTEYINKFNPQNAE